MRAIDGILYPVTDQSNLNQQLNYRQKTRQNQQNHTN
jgi:hypothetical protein